MANIGIVTKSKNGTYEGRLITLTIKAPIRIVPIGQTNEKAPTHRIVSEGAEVGAAWTKKSQQSGEEYLSLTFDTPELPNVIYANLGVAAGQDDEDVFAIIWNRPSK